MKGMVRQKQADQMRRAQVIECRVDEGERRVALSFASEEPVKRWFGPEILSLDPECVNLERLQEIGTALFNHDRDYVVGRVEHVRLDPESRKAYCDIVFDSDDKSDVIYQKVKSGSLKGVSFAYSIDRYEDVAAGEVSSNGRFNGPCRVITRWTPLEVSVVSVPADHTVGVGRSAEEKEGTNMAGEHQGAAETAVRTPEEILAQERARVKEIHQMCRDFGLDGASFIEEGRTVEEARSFVLEELKKRNKPITVSIQHDANEEKAYRKAAVDGILLRGGMQVAEPVTGAAEMRGMRLRDLAIDCVGRTGYSGAHRLDDAELFRRALSPDSAFAGILSNAVNKSMAIAYQSMSTTFQAWTGTGAVNDFKEGEVWQISEAGELEPLTQNGEFKFDEGTMQKATRKIATFGREFGFTRQAMINDDLDMLTKIPMTYVRAAYRGVNKLVYQTLAANGVIYDGDNLFSTKHKNIAGTGAALSIATLGQAKTAMRKQTNLRGKERLNISPKYLIVPPELEVEAMQLMQSTADPNGANSGVANVFRNALNIVVDAELTDPKAWYLAAAPTDIDGIMVSYLNGDPAPKLESQVGFDYLGIKYRIYMDYGVDVIDYRGLYKNAGK